MFVTLASGRELSIQFVHSSHDFKTQDSARPGGLRQITDNLARSLRRRVSLCEIADVTVEDATEQTGVAGSTTTSFVPIAQGFGVCHWIDQFDKLSGRAYSLDRALEVSGLTHEEQEEVWQHFAEELDRLLDMTAQF